MGTTMKSILAVGEFGSKELMITEVVAQKTIYLLIHVRTCLEAVEASRDIKPDIFLIDDQLSGMNGLTMYRQLHAMRELSDVPAIIIKAAICHSDIDQEEAVQCQIMELKKPFDLGTLLPMIDHLVLTYSC